MPTTVVVPLADEPGFPDDASQALCRSALESLQGSLERLKRESAEGGLHSFAFKLQSRDEDGKVLAEWSEAELFEHAAHFPSLHPALLAYAVATAEGAHDTRMWADPETPAGTAAMLALVMRDRAWIPAYVDFLRSCDMDHEVDQWGDMDQVVARYGWQADTCALASARLVSCHGQHGNEQFSDWLQTGLGDYLETIEGRAAFMTAAKAEFDADSPQMRRNLTLSREAFCDDVDFWLDFFAPAFNAAELDEVRLHAHGRWDRARA